MKKILATIIFSFLLSGCVAHVTPEGTYLEPLPMAVVIGPPVIVAPPPHIVLRPLPPVIVYPGRHLYFYSDLYYYYRDGLWYYSERERGPWHRLPREYFPKHYRGKDRDRDRDRDYDYRPRY